MNVRSAAGPPKAAGQRVASPGSAAALAASVGVQRPQRRWPRWFRRGPAEMAATAVIAIGVLMLLQPFVLTLYTWSFVTTLAGTALFMIVSKFPD
jgi:hypothetical protein